MQWANILLQATYVQQCVSKGNQRENNTTAVILVTLASFAVPDLSLVMSCPDADTCLAALAATALFSIDVVLIYAVSFLEMVTPAVAMLFWGVVEGGVHKSFVDARCSFHALSGLG